MIQIGIKGVRVYKLSTREFRPRLSSMIQTDITIEDQIDQVDDQWFRLISKGSEFIRLSTNDSDWRQWAMIEIIIHVCMWVCGCVSLWVCECVHACMCACVHMWVCECVGVWVCGCVGMWVCGCVECVGVWVCGVCLDSFQMCKQLLNAKIYRNKLLWTKKNVRLKSLEKLSDWKIMVFRDRPFLTSIRKCWKVHWSLCF